MTTVVYVLMFLGYVFGAFFLLSSSVVGLTSTKKLRGLTFALALFVLLPWSLLWARVVIPLLGLTALGYALVSLGMLVRTKLFVWRDFLIEEIRNNLAEEDGSPEDKENME